MPSYEHDVIFAGVLRCQTDIQTDAMWAVVPLRLIPDLAIILSEGSQPSGMHHGVAQGSDFGTQKQLVNHCLLEETKEVSPERRAQQGHLIAIGTPSYYFTLAKR